MKTLEEMQGFSPKDLIPFFCEAYPENTTLRDELVSAEIVEWGGSAYCYVVNTPISVEYSLDFKHPDYWIVVLDVILVDGIEKLAGIEFVGNVC